jgi:2-haloacid dehalogenase
MRFTPVFDIGQVLLRWEPKAGLRRFFEGDEAVDAFMREVDFLRWHEAQDRGRPIRAGVAAASADFPRHAHVFKGFYDDWFASVPGALAENVAFFERLCDRQDVYGLSNFARDLFDRTAERHPFLKRFRGLVLSGDEQLVKPDPRIYRVLLERYRLAPESCVFVDDSLPNVEAARAVGMKAAHYDGRSPLTSLFEPFGLS